MDYLTPYAKKLGYTDDQLGDFALFLESISTIMEKANPMEWDHNGAKLENGKVLLPGNFESLLKELIEKNEMYAWFTPEKYGGYGYSNVFQLGVMNIIGYVDLSFSIMGGISFTVLESLLHKPNGYHESIIEGFTKGKNIGYVGFTEPQAGSNLQNVKTRSELNSNTYNINGSKIWISNGGIANTGLVLTQNIVDGKADGHNMFICDKLPEVLRLEEKSGLRASPTAQLEFKDIELPKEAIVGPVGNGYRGVLERLMSMRIGVAMQATASSERMRDIAKTYAETREQFDSPIMKFPGVQRKIYEMDKQIPRMYKYSYVASHGLDRFYRGWIPTEVGATGPSAENQAASMLPGIVLRGLAHYYASSSKLYTSEIVQHIAYDASQIFGGNGFVMENEINKIMRDIRVLSIYEGTSEIHEWILSRSKQAVEMIPNLKSLTSTWDEKTYYEDMLFLRFPKLKSLI
jgi:alkylation response protein AidB-like acyl-CoA dehydrogenase